MSIWQTKSWQEMLKKSGQVSESFDIPPSNSPLTGGESIFVEKRKVAMWEYWLFVLWLEKEITKKDYYDLIKLCKEQKCLFLQIENINYKPHPSPLLRGEGITLLKKSFYKKFITPYTAIINLEKTEEEILANMKPKGRYNIKLAWKKEVKVEFVEKTDENIKLYYDLMLETTSRDNFSWNNLSYYNTFLNSLENSKLILAKKDWVTIAWWIFVFDKDVSIYYYWASTSKKEYRNLMAPYLIQWEALKYSKNIWSKIYDFLWVSSPNEKNSSLAWVTDFKKKLTKEIIEVSSSQIYINKKIKYFIIKFLRNLKK